MMKKGVKTWFVINGLAILVGLAGGMGAVVFRMMIDLFRFVFFDLILPNISLLWGDINLAIVLLPALGGLVAGPIIQAVAPETKGHGVPEVMEAVQRQGGRIRARVAATKVLVSSITIGSGGSVGREGPIAQIGSTLGSVLGLKFGLSEPYVRLLVVCGLAAGVSATFMAPLGGAIFGIEVIYRGVAPYDVIPVFLASVVGMVVTGEVFGLEPAFRTPPYILGNPLELVYFIPMGAALGLMSILWVRTLYGFEDFFEKLPMREWLKPALGGLLTGFAGILLSGKGILGVGYEGIDQAIAGSIPVVTLLVLGIMKIVATSLTVGSGGSGGIFAPSLYIGAMFGGFMGSFVSKMPLASSQPYVYMLVGMAALFAGASKAPLTCIVMLPEMTDNYHLLSPLMLACATSYFVSTILTGDSIYTLKLKRRGVDIETSSSPLELVHVDEVMTPVDEVISVKRETPLSVVSFMIWETKHTGFPVMEDDRLVGMVTLRELPDIPLDELEEATVGDVMVGDVATAHADWTIRDVLDSMNEGDREVLPVVSPDDRGKILGIVSKRDAIEAYQIGSEKMHLLQT